VRPFDLERGASIDQRAENLRLDAEPRPGLRSRESRSKWMLGVVGRDASLQVGE
jgi:hypothetical protein